MCYYNEQLLLDNQDILVKKGENIPKTVFPKEPQRPDGEDIYFSLRKSTRPDMHRKYYGT